MTLLGAIVTIVVVMLLMAELGAGSRRSRMWRRQPRTQRFGGNHDPEAPRHSGPAVAAAASVRKEHAASSMGVPEKALGGH